MAVRSGFREFGVKRSDRKKGHKKENEKRQEKTLFAPPLIKMAEQQKKSRGNEGESPSLFMKHIGGKTFAEILGQIRYKIRPKDSGAKTSSIRERQLAETSLD